ncbi:MAG: DUF433 domain-containing protein [Bryobacteraceae bacterium]|nr:DUF433 domain-containing protein [Solibacteraceae bacterium]MCO5353004.1 DUF433 domain-containing protein [Bryobacteraceae bacterium]
MTGTIPLTKDSKGVYRIGSTRVTLDAVIRAFRDGATAEQIAGEYAGLDLADVYQVIGHYLKNEAEFREYLRGRATEEEAMVSRHREEWSPRGLRGRLLARRGVKEVAGRGRRGRQASSVSL